MLDRPDVTAIRQNTVVTSPKDPVTVHAVIGYSKLLSSLLTYA